MASRRLRPPELVIRIPLEGDASITFQTASSEDELRLRCWLRRTRRLVHLQRSLEGILDDLDAVDERHAA